MSATGSITYNNQGSSNNTLGKIADNVSVKITGKAATTSSRPTKAEIVNAINEVQTEVLNDTSDWTFLNTIEQVEGFTTETTTSSLTNGTSYSNSVIWLGGTASQTDKLYTPITLDASKLKTLSALFEGEYSGFGLFNGTIQAKITDSNYNTIIESDIITVVDYVTAQGTINASNVTALNIDFDFTQANAIGAGDYYLMFEVVANALSGAGVSINLSNPVGTAFYSLGGAAWIATLSPYYTLTYYNCTYTTTLTMPEDCRYLNCIRYGNETLIPYTNARNQYNPMLQPTGTFSVTGMDSNGNQLVYVKSSNTNVLYWLAEYQKIPNTLSLDSDIPVIPKAYTDILMYGSIVMLASANNGIIKDLSFFQAKYEKALERMKIDYLPFENASVSVAISGYTDSYADDCTISTPNGWETFNRRVE